MSLLGQAVCLPLIYIHVCTVFTHAVSIAETATLGYSALQLAQNTAITVRLQLLLSIVQWYHSALLASVRSAVMSNEHIMLAHRHSLRLITE